MYELVLGTHNRKKGGELQHLLAPFEFRVRTLDEFPSAIKVVEDGETFAENAAKKAVQQAQHLGRWALGEDSGLMVDALGGAPGVYSARFAGVDGDDEANNAKLLSELGDIPLEKRTAHYMCHVALSDPAGQLRAQFYGKCSGRILSAPLGTGGFGYDPLFEIVEYHQTFAQLGVTVKSVLSHRGRAMRQLIPHLLQLCQFGAWSNV